jgi:hypothetical protein
MESHKIPWFQSPPTSNGISNRFPHGSVFPMGKIPWIRTLGGIAPLTKTQEEGPVGPERSVKLGSSQIDPNRLEEDSNCFKPTSNKPYRVGPPR